MSFDPGLAPRLTALCAAPLLVFLALLGMAISFRRRRDRIGPGMTGDAAFTRLQRAHANAAEHVPLLLFGLMIFEFTHPGSQAVISLGALILVARAAHAAGLLLRSRHPLHALGGALTYALEIGFGVLLLRVGLTALGHS